MHQLVRPPPPLNSDGNPADIFAEQRDRLDSTDQRGTFNIRVMAEEYHEIVGTYVGRPESPHLEIAAGKAIEQAFRDLIETRYFYQKTTLSYTALDEVVTRGVEAAIQYAKEVQRTIIGPNSGGAIPKPVTAERLAELHHEVETRPWNAVTRHQGDRRLAAEIHRVANAGTQALGTPVEKMNLAFFLPAVHMHCSGRCKRTCTFAALVSSTPCSFENPFPREIAGVLEQIFTPVYRCEMCRESIFVILIRRLGARLQLCGFAPRRPIEGVTGLPDELAPILSDADQAIAEGDTNGAFYHLRTLIEHYQKRWLGKALDEQIRGEDLAAEYYSSLPTDLRGILPSLSTSWATLSKWIHARSGRADDYEAQRAVITKHVATVVALGLDASK